MVADPIFTFPQIASLRSVAIQIRKILRDNERIFKNFGPNSSSKFTEDVRWDLKAWDRLKKEKIVPNNNLIKKLIEQYMALFPDEIEPIVIKMINHIEVFEIHCQDPSVQYSDNQFPVEFERLINDLASDVKNPGAFFRVTGTWIEDEFINRNIPIIEGFFLGSILRERLRPQDVDICFLIHDIEPKRRREISAELKKIKRSFKRKFNTALHLTIFRSHEKAEYDCFLHETRVKAYLWLKGGSSNGEGSKL